MNTVVPRSPHLRRKPHQKTPARLVQKLRLMYSTNGDTSQPKRDKYAGLSRRAKRRKMSMEVDKEIGDSASLNAAIRATKKAAKGGKIGEALKKGPTRMKHNSKSKTRSRTASVFEQDLSAKKARGEGARAKKGDTIGGMGKRKGGKR